MVRRGLRRLRRGGQRGDPRQAFGEEIGQNSWLTADEHRGFRSPRPRRLQRGARGRERIGRAALFMVRETGCHVTGVDLHDDGVAAANAAAADLGLAERARFTSTRASRCPSTTRASTRSSHRLHQPHVRARACPARLAPRAAPRRAPALHRSDRRDRDAAARGDDAAAAEWASSCSARPASTRRCCAQQASERFRLGQDAEHGRRGSVAERTRTPRATARRDRGPRGERPVPGLPGRGRRLASERRLSRLALLARKPTA